MTDASVNFLAGLIQIPSLNVLFDKPGSTANYDATLRALQYLGNYAKSAEVHYLNFENPHPEFPKAVPNAVFRWKKGNPTQRFGYIGHVDVVNVNPADWHDGNAFSGKVVNGIIYGRGATDMKGSVAAFFVAMEKFVADPANDNFDIVAMISGDEEVMALNGARPTFAWMRENDLWPDVWLVGEPSSTNKFGNLFAEGRRGLVAGDIKAKGRNPIKLLDEIKNAIRNMAFPHEEGWPYATRLEFVRQTSADGGVSQPADNKTAGRLRVFGVGGHSANPETYVNPIDILDRIKQSMRTKLEAQGIFLAFTSQVDSNPFPTPNIVPAWAEVGWIVGFNPAGRGVEDATDHVVAAIQAAMAEENLKAAHVVLANDMGTPPEDGSKVLFCVDNKAHEVIPDSATVMWSIRFTPCDTAQGIADRIGDVIKATLNKLGEPLDTVVYTPRVDLHAGSFLSKLGRLRKCIMKAAWDVLGIRPKPTRGGGNSDGRFAREVDPDIEIIEFGTSQNGGLDPNDPLYGIEGGMHQVNECLSIADYSDQIEVDIAIVRNFFED